MSFSPQLVYFLDRLSGFSTNIFRLELDLPPRRYRLLLRRVRASMSQELANYMTLHNELSGTTS